MKTMPRLTVSAVTLLLAAGSAVNAAPPPKPPVLEVARVTATTSQPMGVVPSAAGATWTYGYAITEGQSIVDALPVEICTTETRDPLSPVPSHYPAKFSFRTTGNGGSLGAFVSLADASVTFTADACLIATIRIATGPLAEGDYTYNVNLGLDSTNNGRTIGNVPGVIHVRVHAAAAPKISCFQTDSSFNFLAACDGTDVTSGDEGRFAIVVNRKNVAVATNPGQQYYNVVWTNDTGMDQVVNVDFARQGLTAHGAQAIHVLVTPQVLDMTWESFEAVNDAIPAGADDAAGPITVPAGWTLWADYHVQYAGIGQPLAAGTATTCETANQMVSVTATISGDDLPAVSCTAGGRGYRK